MFKIRHVKVYVDLLIVLLLGGCSIVADGSIMEKQVVFQSILVGNGGQGTITNPQILFEGISLINKFQKDFAPIKKGWKGIAPMVIETMDLPIPETAEITWQSEDNRMHSVTAPIRSIIRDRDLFYGFHFVFVDDHVEIFLIEKKQFKVPPPTPVTVETKVFTSSE